MSHGTGAGGAGKVGWAVGGGHGGAGPESKTQPGEEAEEMGLAAAQAELTT